MRDWIDATGASSGFWEQWRLVKK